MKTRALVCAAAFLASCAGAPEPEAPGLSREELAAYPGMRLWANAISVCFAFTGVTAHDFAVSRAAAMGALAETWEAASALRFTDVGFCPQGPLPSGTLKIELVANSTGAGYCGGDGLTGTCVVGYELDRIRDVVVHEVGHALGFGHEHQRMSAGTWEAPLCAFERDRWDDSNAVVAAQHTLCFAGGPGPHAPSDPLPDGTCSPGTWPLDVPLAQSFIANRAPVALTNLTLFDADSIMSYCSGESRRLGGAVSSQLSPLDALGAEMAYPTARTQLRLVGWSGASFDTADGVLSRSDVPLTISSEWLRRGADPSFFTQTQWSWGTGTPTSTATAITFAAPRTTSVTLKFTDTLGGSNAGASVVVADSARHTALLMSLLF